MGILLHEGATQQFLCVPMQAFFIQTDEELERWVQTNPQYSKEQHMQLGSAIAEFRGLKRKDKAVLLGKLEACML